METLLGSISGVPVASRVSQVNRRQPVPRATQIRAALSYDSSKVAKLSVSVTHADDIASLM